MKIVDFLRNCEMETVVTCFTTDGKGSCHRFVPSFFKELIICRCQSIAGDDQATLMVDKNSANIAYTFRFYVSLRLGDRDCYSAADGKGSCHRLAPSFFEEITHCRHKKLHWRWPGNPNDRSKFCNLRLFTFTRSQLTLCSWRRLPEIAHTAHSRHQIHRRRWPGSFEIPQLRKLCLQVQAKPLEKHNFAARIPPLWWCCALLFSYYHSQRLLFSPTKNNFSTTLTLTEKPRYTYWRVFCTFYL